MPSRISCTLFAFCFLFNYVHCLPCAPTWYFISWRVRNVLIDWLIDWLTVTPVLATPIFDGKTQFILQCVASAEACVACLVQKQSDSNEKLISYASMKLTDTQRKLSVIELEDYAVIFRLRHFETYLIGALIVIVTDHNHNNNNIQICTRQCSVNQLSK